MENKQINYCKLSSIDYNKIKSLDIETLQILSYQFKFHQYIKLSINIDTKMNNNNNNNNNDDEVDNYLSCLNELYEDTKRFFDLSMENKMKSTSQEQELGYKYQENIKEFLTVKIYAFFLFFIFYFFFF